MTTDDSTKQFAEFAAKIRREAFAAGWNAAVAAFNKAIETEAPPEAMDAQIFEYAIQSPPKLASTQAGPAPGTIPYVALQVIRRRDGMTGSEVVAAVEASGIKTSDPVVRTALKRLKKRKLVASRHKKWYPV